jgi:hypothetical protein
LTAALHWNLDAEALEVDYSGEDRKGSKKVHNVGEVLTEECLTKR